MGAPPAPAHGRNGGKAHRPPPVPRRPWSHRPAPARSPAPVSSTGPADPSKIDGPREAPRSGDGGTGAAVAPRIGFITAGRGAEDAGARQQGCPPPAKTHQRSRRGPAHAEETDARPGPGPRSSRAGVLNPSFGGDSGSGTTPRQMGGTAGGRGDADGRPRGTAVPGLHRIRGSEHRTIDGKALPKAVISALRPHQSALVGPQRRDHRGGAGGEVSSGAGRPFRISDPAGPGAGRGPGQLRFPPCSSSRRRSRIRARGPPPSRWISRALRRCRSASPGRPRAVSASARDSRASAS